ncbi:MAG: hypothetical protein PHV74_02440 [Dehalococcoidia bacterium]|nr:hypothetical protein [Dehalococcoidia bacterium]
MPRMKIWGMLSPEDEKPGFDLVLDEDWYALFLYKGQLVTRFDPRDYTAAELQEEMGHIMQTLREDQGKEQHIRVFK